MGNFIKKTLGGLSGGYYFRQLFFGSLMTLLAVLAIDLPSAVEKETFEYRIIIILTANALLYPYSRFAYESIVGFIMGDNVFIVNAIFMLVVKVFTMLVCWLLAVFIAPIGLIYLYFYHSKSSVSQDS